MLKKSFVHTFQKVTAVRNAFGDQEFDASAATTEIMGRLRESIQIIRLANQELYTTDAMAWFAPSESIAENDILLCEEAYWRVIKLVKARRLGRTAVQFLKCYLERDKGAIS